MNQGRVKFCAECKEVKPLEGGYYKAGNSWQKLCKICHNAKRYEYPLTPSTYIKKPTGFAALPKEKQDKIIYDVYIRKSYKNIAQDCDIRYGTLLIWKRKGRIPAYVAPVN